MNLKCLSAIPLLFWLFAASALAPLPLEAGTFALVNYPGAFSTVASGINDQEQVVGTYQTDAQFYHGFLYKNGSYTQIDCPNAQSTLAYGINNSGVIVGFCVLSSTTEGFIYQNGQFTLFAYPKAVNTYFYAINQKGAIVGGYNIIDKRGKYHLYGLEWNNVKFTSIRHASAVNTFTVGINDAGIITGSYGGPAYYGFEYRNGVFREINYPGAQGATFPNGINDHNTVVGGYVLTQNHGFEYAQGKFTTIDYPGGSGTNTGLSAVNINGIIVGSFEIGNPQVPAYQGFVYTP